MPDRPLAAPAKGHSAVSWTPCGRMPLAGGGSAQQFKRGALNVLIAQEAGRWHLSISTPTRYPTWDEIADARYALLPDSLEVAMLLPPRAHYVNLHPYCLHLWEIRDEGIPIEREPTGQRRSHETGAVAP